MDRDSNSHRVRQRIRKERVSRPNFRKVGLDGFIVPGKPVEQQTLLST